MTDTAFSNGAAVAAAPDSARAARQPLLRIEGVVKSFGGFQAVDGVTLEIAAGEFFALLGPSGCGKTTLLRMLAGFEAPDQGRILLGGEDIGQALPHQRPVNMMFQSYALFPHLSVADNVAFGLKRAGMSRADISTRVAEMLALVKLQGLEKRKPDQLSGGQRQRVALARALARRPQLLLLDEPLAALDKKLRESTQAELMELQRRLGMTFIIVTHDQEEAMTMATRIGVMDAGRLVQVANPRELYEAPRTRWIAQFVGDVNVFDGDVRAQDADGLVVETTGAGRIVVARQAGATDRAKLSVAIRPEKIRLARADLSETDLANRLNGVISDVSYLGGTTAYKIRLEAGGTLRASLANTARRASNDYAAGDHVVAWFMPDDCLVLDR